MAAPTREQIDDIYRRRIQQARRTPPEEKLLAGARLFDYACRTTLSGIRNANAGIDTSSAVSILRDRLALQRQREERHIYTVAEQCDDE